MLFISVFVTTDMWKRNNYLHTLCYNTHEFESNIYRCIYNSKLSIQITARQQTNCNLFSFCESRPPATRKSFLQLKPRRRRREYGRFQGDRNPPPQHTALPFPLPSPFSRSFFSLSQSRPRHKFYPREKNGN